MLIGCALVAIFGKIYVFMIDTFVHKFEIHNLNNLKEEHYIDGSTFCV